MTSQCGYTASGVAIYKRTSAPPFTGIGWRQWGTTYFAYIFVNLTIIIFASMQDLPKTSK